MDFIKLIVIGVILGVANVIPGVSGGTLAVVFNIYDRLISVITLNVKKIFSEWKVLEEDFSRIPIFCDVKIRGIWGKPFNADNFFVRIDKDL